METIKKIQATIAKVSLILSAIALSTVVVAITLSVLDRFVFKIGMVWAEQYSRYMLIWSVFLAANVLIYRNELMRVDFFDSFWPKNMLRVREAVYTVIFLFMLILLTVKGTEQAVANIGVKVLGFPIDKFWVYLCIPVGSGLMLLQYIGNLILDFMKPKGEGK